MATLLRRFGLLVYKLEFNNKYLSKGTCGIWGKCLEQCFSPQPDITQGWGGIGERQRERETLCNTQL